MTNKAGWGTGFFHKPLFKEQGDDPRGWALFTRVGRNLLLSTATSAWRPNVPVLHLYEVQSVNSGIGIAIVDRSIQGLRRNPEVTGQLEMRVSSDSSFGDDRNTKARRRIFFTLLLLYSAGIAWGYFRLPWAAVRNLYRDDDIAKAPAVYLSSKLAISSAQRRYLRQALPVRVVPTVPPRSSFDAPGRACRCP